MQADIAQYPVVGRFTQLAKDVAIEVQQRDLHERQRALLTEMHHNRQQQQQQPLSDSGS